MNDKRDDGGTAFPAYGEINGREAVTVDGPGMSLLDYFAAAALQGMLAADGNDPRWTGKDTGPDHQRGGGKWLDPEGVARQAYDVAEAMIARRRLPRERETGLAAELLAALKLAKPHLDYEHVPSDVWFAVVTAIDKVEDSGDEES